MNIATSKLNAPLEKQASIYDAALEYLGSGGLTKLLPQGFAGNHALAAGAGALGSDVTRRVLRSRGLGDASSSALGSLVGMGLGGAQGGAGALAALHPAVRSRTAGTGLKNILGTTAFLSGGEHLGKMVADVNPAALVNDATYGTKMIGSPLAPSVSGTPALVTERGVGELAKSVGAKGIGEVSALKDELARRLGLLGSGTASELSNTDLYKTLGSVGLGAGALGGGLHTLKPDWLKKITEYAGKTPRAAAMGLGGLGLAAAGAPILGAGTALAGLAAAGPTRDALKYLYKNAPGGTLPAMLGGGTALLGAPLVGSGLGLGALAANPLFRSGAKGAGQLAGKGIIGTGQLAGKGIVGGGQLAAKGYKALPQGSILGGAGLAATVGGMPLYGVPAMLAAPFYNPRSSKFIGDVARELRAPVVQAQEAQKTKEVIDGLYKKSSYSIKLAAPVYRTRPAYCLDAPTMDKVAFLPQMMEAGAKFLGKSQRALFGGNKTKLLDRGAQALQRGAREAGTMLTPEQARRQAEAFFRQDAGGLGEVVARKAPKRGTRAGYADIGTEFEGSADAIQQQLDQGTHQGWEGYIPFKNRLIRKQNMRDIEQQMLDRGRQGTAPTSPLTASTEASAKAQAELTSAQQAAQRARTGRTVPAVIDSTTGAVITPARFEPGTVQLENQLTGANQRVTRLTAPVQPAQESATRAQEAVTQTRQHLDALPQYSNEQATFSGMYNPVGVGEIVAQRIRGYNTAQINSRIAELTAGGRPVAGPKLQELRKLEQMRSASNPVTETALSRVEKILGKPDAEAAIEARITKIEDMKGPNPDTKAELDILKSLRSERTATTPGTSATTRIQGATGDATELNRLNNVVRNDQKVLTDLQAEGLVTSTTTPEQMVNAVEQRLSKLRNKPNLSNAEQDLLQKLERLEVTTPGTSATSTVENYIDPANFDRAREAIAKQRERLTQVGERTTLEADLVTNQAALATAEADLEAAIRARDAGLPGAEQALNKAQRNLNIQKRRAEEYAYNVTKRKRGLDAAQASEKATQDLLSAPVANPVTSQLGAPVQKTVVEGVSKPEVVEVLSARGIEGIAPGMEEQLRLLEAAGQDTGKLVNSAAKRSGLPKAVTGVNKAGDQLVNEAVASMNLTPQELEAVQNAVRQMSSKGEPLTESGLTALLGTSNANTKRAFTEIERLATGTGPSARQYGEASTKLTESFNEFGRQLGNEFSTAQGLAADASYAGMRKGVQSATEQPGRFKRLFSRNPQKPLTGEDVEAIEAVEALTSARVQAIETAISGQGGNAALAQAARPQLYAASEAVARSGSPDIARAWARALQEPGSLAKSIEANPQLKLLIEKEAPELLRANNKAFNLSVEQAGELQGLIPRAGRGGSAENIAKELELGFKPETLKDTASPRAQEALQAMKDADGTFGTRMETLLEAPTPAHNSAASKVLSGTTDVAKLTFDELAALEGVTNIGLDSATVNNIVSGTTRQNAALQELTAIRGTSTVEESLAYIEKELKSLKTPKGSKGKPPTPNPRKQALEDARKVIREQLNNSNSEFTTEYVSHMGKSKRNLETIIKQDSRVDVSQLRRNTDVAKVKVERSTMDTLYQQPILDESGNLVFNEADLTKQLEHLTSLRGNANVPQEVLQSRVIEENLARLKDAGADQQVLNNARANLESMFQVSSVDAVAQGGGRGGGMMAGLATLGATGLGAGAMSNRGPGPATQARQQVRASWGLSPLHAPVIQSKLAAAVKPISLKATQPKLPKADKIPAQSLLTATVEGQEQAMKMSSFLLAPVGGSYYGHV